MPHSVGGRKGSGVRGGLVFSPKAEEDAFPQFTMQSVEGALSGKKLPGNRRPPIVCLSKDGHNYYCVCTKTAKVVSKA